MAKCRDQGFQKVGVSLQREHDAAYPTAQNRVSHMIIGLIDVRDLRTIAEFELSV